MKFSFRLLALTALIALFGSVFVSAQNENPPPNPMPPAHGHLEHHPAIRAAIRALERAKAEMEHADHDFGGHRVAALQACDQAIAQLRIALHYDRK